jgi:hypothetical protein
MCSGARITIVNGYHALTPVARTAVDAMLGNRFAVIFHTDRPGMDVMYFDSTLFCNVLEAIASEVDYDDLRIDLDGSATLVSLDELRVKLQDDREESEPPRRIEFLKGNHLSCVEETEFWNLVGGPQPYSDSYTASFYTSTDMSTEFTRACQQTCGTADVTIVEAARSPLPVPLWRRLLG